MRNKKDTKPMKDINETKETLETPEVPEVSETAAAGENAQSAAEPEIPDVVTLTKDEFLKVKQRIEAMEKENAENVVLLQRLQADFDNYRKRNANISCESAEEGVRNLMKALLPVLDDLDRAIDAAPASKDRDWVSGVKLVRSKFHDILGKNGLEEIEADGCFDPEFHHAVLQEEADGKESGDILEVLQKGYKVKNRIIRHTMVKVAK